MVNYKINCSSELKELRIVIFLNGNRGYEVIKELVRSGYNIVLAVIGTDLTKVSEIIKFIECNGISYQASKRVNSTCFLSNMKSADVDLFLIAGFSQIFSDKLLGIPKFGVLNLHAGKLPEYRGGSPLNWQIINGEKFIFISVILADKGIDTGNVICERYFELASDEDIVHAHRKADSLFPKMVIESIELVMEGFQGVKQDEGKAKYWLQRSSCDSQISCKTQSAVQINNIVRSLSIMYGGALCVDKNKQVALHIFASELPELAIHGSPGRMVKLNGSYYLICRDMAIKLCDFKFDREVEFRLNELLFE